VGVLTERLRRTSRDLGDARDQIALLLADEVVAGAVVEEGE
jgi:hypothetical protein